MKNRESHDGMSIKDKNKNIKYKNTGLSTYYPFPVFWMRFQVKDSRLFCSISKEIPEYHNVMTISKPNYKMSVNISGILDVKEVLTIDRRLWNVYYFTGRQGLFKYAFR